MAGVRVLAARLSCPPPPWTICRVLRLTATRGPPPRTTRRRCPPPRSADGFGQQKAPPGISGRGEGNPLPKGYTMSAFRGSQGKGAMRRHCEQKRVEAEARDAALPLNSPKRRRNRLAVSR